MTHDPIRSTSITDIGSSTWQPDAVGEQGSTASTYLDRVATTPLMRDAMDRTTAFLDLHPGHAILEVGCGNGVVLPQWATLVGPSGRVVGVDHAEAFVVEARERIAAEGYTEIVSVDVGDAYALPYDDNSFDAAHCERVLMHLDDPTATLREMARVVRPGGRVVVTEPDWQMIPFDHPDQRTLTLLYDRFLKRFRQPDVGRTLYRRLGDGGLIDRQVAPVVHPVTNLEVYQMYGLNLDGQVDGVVADGLVTQEQAEDAIAFLDTANRDGRFFTIVALFVAMGKTPDD